MDTVSEYVEREHAEGVFFGPFHRYWLLHNPRVPEKVRRQLELAAKRPDLVGMPRQGFEAMDSNDFPPASFTAVTASATETNLWTPNIWTPIPANDMRSGKSYILSFGGIYTSTATPGVITWTLRVGQSATPTSNVLLGASNSTAPPASLTNAPFYGQAEVGIRTIGIAASGATGVGHMFVHVQGAAAASAIDYIAGGTVATTIDNTAATGLVVSITISVASQSYTCQWVKLRSSN